MGSRTGSLESCNSIKAIRDNNLMKSGRLLLFMLFVALGGRCPAAEQPSRPDILLIMPDQMRGDCLSILGHAAVKTPQLDKLARQGVLFRRAYSTVPSCIPAPMPCSPACTLRPAAWWASSRSRSIAPPGPQGRARPVPRRGPAQDPGALAGGAGGTPGPPARGFFRRSSADSGPALSGPANEGSAVGSGPCGQLIPGVKYRPSTNSQCAGMARRDASLMGGL